MSLGTPTRPTPTTSVRTDALPQGVPSVIALLLVSAFVVLLNETIMGVALPTLVVDLGITVSTGQWLTTGFLLTMAIVIPLTGLILKRFKTRSVFIGAMSLFSVGTLVAALAPGFEVLLLGRVIQASGTAIMLPLLMTTALTFVPAARRGRMMGLISIVIAVAPAVGPTISGLILSSLSWRWMFLLVLPIAVIALVLGAVMVKNISAVARVRFDFVSVALSALGFGGLVFGLSSIGEGHAVIPPLLAMGVGLVSLALFVYRQTILQPRGRALLDLRPFRSFSFTLPLILMVVSMATLLGSLILLPLYLQGVLGSTTLETGLMLLPGGVAMGVAAPIVGRLFDSFGPRPLVVPGAVMMSAALWGMTTFDEGTSVGFVIAFHVLLNIGLGFLMTPLMTSALGSLPRELYSHGSAIVNTLQQVAGAAGTALFVTLMTGGTLAAEGLGPVAAQAAGVHTALLWGAVISLIPIALAFLVRRPANELPEGAGIH